MVASNIHRKGGKCRTDINRLVYLLEEKMYIKIPKSPSKAIKRERKNTHTCLGKRLVVQFNTLSRPLARGGSVVAAL